MKLIFRWPAMLLFFFCTEVHGAVGGELSGVLEGPPAQEGAVLAAGTCAQLPMVWEVCLVKRLKGGRSNDRMVRK